MSENCDICGKEIDGEILKSGLFDLQRELPEYKAEAMKDVCVCKLCAHKAIVERKSKKLFIPAFDAFASEVNVMGYERDAYNVEAAIDGFIRQHRSLQSTMLNFTRLFLKRLGELAEKEPNRFTDPRNQQALEWAKEVGKLDWRQPFI